MSRRIGRRGPVSRGIRRIIVRASPLGRSRATVAIGSLVFPAAIGRTGMTSRKREGDGATPRAAMRLQHGYFRSDRIARPQSRLPLAPIGPQTGWCDAPAHACYNRPVGLPFKASHERLLRDDALYDICLVMDWNRRSRRRNGGSAIFFHVAREGYRPTEGCVAVSRRVLQRILALAGPDTIVEVR